MKAVVFALVVLCCGVAWASRLEMDSVEGSPVACVWVTAEEHPGHATTFGGLEIHYVDGSSEFLRARGAYERYEARGVAGPEGHEKAQENWQLRMSVFPGLQTEDCQVEWVVVWYWEQPQEDRGGGAFFDSLRVKLVDQPARQLTGDGTWSKVP